MTCAPATARISTPISLLGKVGGHSGPLRYRCGNPFGAKRWRVDGYHCWAEFFVEGKWWPIDISEGNKYTSLATYELATIRPTASNSAGAATLWLNRGPLQAR